MGSLGSPEPLSWDTASDLKVTLVGEPRLVQTAEPVEANQGSLWLSNLDQNACSYTTETIYLYKARPGNPAAAEEGCCGEPAEEWGKKLHTQLKAAAVDDNPAAVLRTALARALVLFYPFTGRLGVTSGGMYEIRLNGEGVVFIEAEANLELARLGYGTGVVPPPAVAGQLVVKIPDTVQGPLMVAQVTRFQCGGWALGITMNHGVVDGGSAMKFMHVWARLAKLPGSSLTDFAPFVIDRTCLQRSSPVQLRFDHAGLYDNGAEIVNAEHGKSEAFVFRLKAEEIKVLKGKILEDEDCVQITSLTTFEALAALVWRARTRALEMAEEQQTKLDIFVTVRNRLEPPLPEGFIGNTIARGICVTTAGQLSSRPLSYAVKLIREAIASLTDKHIRSFIDYLGHIHPRRLPAAGPPASCLVFNTWIRLGFHLVDFGWGEPVSTGPSSPDILLLDVECRLFLLPLHGDDCRMDMKMMIGLPPSVVGKFGEELRDWLSG